MAGAGMASKCGANVPGSTARGTNEMLSAAKSSHDAVMASGGGAAAALSAGHAAAQRVAPAHMKAKAPVVLTGDAKARDHLSSARETLARISQSSTAKQRGESRLAPYREALDKYKNGDGTKSELRAELRDVRAQRSHAQNRSGDQGDLFGGFKAKPARPANWEAPSAIASRKAAEEAAKPKVAAPVEAPKATSATPFVRSVSPAATAKIDAIRAARNPDARTSMLKAKEERYRDSANAEWRARDAFVKSDKQYAKLDAAYERTANALSNARGRGSERGAALDKKKAELDVALHRLTQELRAEYAHQNPPAAARLDRFQVAKSRAGASRRRVESDEMRRLNERVAEVGRKMSADAAVKRAAEAAKKEAERRAVVAKTNNLPLEHRPLNRAQSPMARGAYARLNKPRLDAEKKARADADVAARRDFTAESKAAISAAPQPRNGHRNIAVGNSAAGRTVKAVKVISDHGAHFVHRAALGDGYSVSHAATGLSIGTFKTAADATRMAAGIKSGRTVERAAEGNKRALAAIGKYRTRLGAAA